MSTQEGDPRFEVSVTAIIRHEFSFDAQPRYLITKRSANKKRFPNLWTVPGGHVESMDAETLVNRDGVAYGALEAAVKREVSEETGLAIHNLRYVTSMTLDGGKVLVISMLADFLGGTVTLDPSEADDFAWVTVQEAESYDLIDGILDELKLADKIR